MAIVVEDGTGLENAVSYLSEADADTYLAAHTESTEWGAASSAEKETALRLATQYLDMVYHTRWKMYRTNEAQALDWPRTFVDDHDGYYIDGDELPQRLLDACAELAQLSITETNGLLPDVAAPGEISETMVKVGPITKSVKYAGSGSQFKKFRLIDLLMSDLITAGTTVSRG